VAGIELPPGMAEEKEKDEEDKGPYCPFLSAVITELKPPKFAGQPPSMGPGLALSNCIEGRCALWDHGRVRCGLL
jgi:hypothetical protein